MIESSSDVPALFFAGFFIVYSIAALVTGARDNIQESADSGDDDLPALARRQAE